MKKVLALLALLAAPALAQDRYPAVNRPTCTDGAPRAVMLFKQTDEDDCDNVNSGTAEAYCECKDGVWSPVSESSGGGSDSFKTIDLDAGTDPSADSPTDTLTIDCPVPMVCTGTSTPDTWVFSWTYTPGPQVSADLGNNGSTESTAINKVTTADDDSGAVTEPNADELRINFRAIPPYDNYDPLRPDPTGNCFGGTGAKCDEFYDNAAGLSWTCNGGTISQSYANDSMVITKAMSTLAQDVAACTVSSPSGSWTATTRISPFFPAAFAQCGIFAIRAGTQSTPTAMSACAIYQNSGTGIDAREQHKTFTSYTAGDTEFGTGRQIGISSEPRWEQMRYDASADTLSCWASWDGIVWIPNGTSSAGVYTIANETSITTDPPFVGFFLDDRANSASQPDMRCEFSMLRVRTDANRNDASN